MALALKINEMDTNEKLMAIEAIWDSLIRDSGEIKSPSWHKDELSSRLANYKAGKEDCVELESAKRMIRRAVK